MPSANNYELFKKSVSITVYNHMLFDSGIWNKIFLQHVIDRVIMLIKQYAVSKLIFFIVKLTICEIRFELEKAVFFYQ